MMNIPFVNFPPKRVLNRDKNTTRHREDGPAIISDDGTTMDISMKKLLNYLCGTLNPVERRLRLMKIMETWFPNRPIYRDQKIWTDGPVHDTVNFVIPFGYGNRDHYITVGAHYDAVPDCPGANDNGAAVIQLILAAKKLSDQGLEPNVDFCFWDHEEIYGSPVMGSKLYANLREKCLPEKALVWDVTGIGDVFYYSGGPEDDPTGLVRDLPYRRTPPSDNINLEIVGIPTTLICALPSGEFGKPSPDTWHTLHSMRDSVEKVWDSSLAMGSDLCVELIGRYSR